MSDLTNDMQAASALYDKVKAASLAFRQYDAFKSDCGLTPDSIKFSPEYRAICAAYDKARRVHADFMSRCVKAHGRKQIDAYQRAQIAAKRKALEVTA